MNYSSPTSLHIPVGINFECTGCGNCCFSWPVPLNDNDVSRLETLAALEARDYIKPLGQRSDALKSSTHSLEKRADGKCVFLDDDNRCKLHSNFGPEAKPAMCQLFPYTFTPTPSGVYASVSFASTGVLTNSGRPLQEQSEHLQSRWSLMQSLNPEYQPDWHSAQLLDGVPISWTEYLAVDRDLLELLRPNGPHVSILSLCEQACSLLMSRLPAAYPLDRNFTETPPEVMDRILISYLLDFYFPDDVFESTESNLPARMMLQHMVSPAAASLRIIPNQLLSEVDPQIDQLLRRFLYCRVFSKLYFGPGYNFLSVTAGLHHLCCLVALVRIALKSAIGTTSGDTFTAAAELVRKLERRLTMARFSRETVSVLEVLFTSPSRVKRILALGA